MTNYNLAIFTICSNNYLPFARVFLSSVRACHPEAALFLCLADRRLPAEALYDEDWTVVEASALDIPDFAQFAFRYDVMELNTAVKPFMFQHLLGERGYEQVFYFDPDIYLFNRLTPVLRPLREGASAVLTPHILEPLENDDEPHDITFMRAGIFNLGFLALRRSDETLALVNWWARRLRYQCLNAQNTGVFVDQKFMDFATSFLAAAVVSRDSTLNAAYWNLTQREFSGSEGAWLVDGRPLTFFHFSGFDPFRPSKLSKYTIRFTGDMSPCLASLTQFYADRLIESGYGTTPRGGYAYAHFLSGTRIHPLARSLFRERHTAWPGDPFANFESFLHQESPLAPKHEVSWTIDNFLAFIYEHMPHLNRVFDLNAPEHARNVVQWYFFGAERDIQLDPRMVAPMIARHERHEVPAPRRSPAADVGRSDATVIGYLRAASGVGEAGRQTLRGLISNGFLADGLDVSLNVESKREEADCEPYLRQTANGRVVIFHVNADQLAAVQDHVGDRVSSTAIRVCVPFWELGRFPDIWRNSFQNIEEIWAPSRFIQRALKDRVPNPVHYVPILVELPPVAPVRRSRFGLPEDRFLFFFAFDFFSFIERKNPMAALDAFRQFRELATRSSPARPGLVIKSMNADLRPEKRDALRASIGDVADIFWIDAALPRHETLGLVSAMDCILSLHRSEGLGLLVAEAMVLGKPVVATDYSATTELLSPATGYPVEYTLVPVGEREYPFPEGQVWAEPDVAHAAWQMARVWAEAGSSQAARRAERAKAAVERQNGRRTVGLAHAHRLRYLAGEPTEYDA